jgi:hypothetical protein
MVLENLKRVNDEVPNAILVDVLLLGDPWMDFIIFKYVNILVGCSLHI